MRKYNFPENLIVFRALTTTMVGLNSKNTEEVLEEKVKEINNKESIGWSWVVLAVASIHF